MRDPMSPTLTMPLLMPIPKWITGWPVRSCSALKSASMAEMSLAVFTANQACSSTGKGAPQNTMTQSPMYLSMVPWLGAMISAIRLNSRFSSACTC